MNAIKAHELIGQNVSLTFDTGVVVSGRLAQIDGSYFVIDRPNGSRIKASVNHVESLERAK